MYVNYNSRNNNAEQLNKVGRYVPCKLVWIFCSASNADAFKYCNINNIKRFKCLICSNTLIQS